MREQLDYPVRGPVSDAACPGTTVYSPSGPFGAAQGVGWRAAQAARPESWRLQAENLKEHRTLLLSATDSAIAPSEGYKVVQHCSDTRSVARAACFQAGGRPRQRACHAALAGYFTKIAIAGTS